MFGHFVLVADVLVAIGKSGRPYLPGIVAIMIVAGMAYLVVTVIALARKHDVPLIDIQDPAV